MVTLNHLPKVNSFRRIEFTSAIIVKHFIQKTENNIIEFSNSKSCLKDQAKILLFKTTGLLVVASGLDLHTKTDWCWLCTDCEHVESKGWNVMWQIL
jgi:hypothetical protein